jgi:undecaprenyl-diphosphatase
MARWTLQPTPADIALARVISRHVTQTIERPSQTLTLLADERFLLLAAGGIWLAARLGDGTQRRHANHLALSVLATSLLPHLMKGMVAQERPDRAVVHGFRHGIPRSGNAYDAFPSGHAVHVGAIASALSWMHPRWTPIVWSVGGLIAATRVVLLAHWLSDVLVGLATGVAIERTIRLLSGPARLL